MMELCELWRGRPGLSWFHNFKSSRKWPPPGETPEKNKRSHLRSSEFDLSASEIGNNRPGGVAQGPHGGRTPLQIGEED